jgi:hypothetical protein
MFHVSCLCLASLSSITQLPVEPVGVLMSSSERDEPGVLSRAAYARLLADREVQAKPPQSVYAAAAEAIERGYEGEPAEMKR